MNRRAFLAATALLAAGSSRTFAQAPEQADRIVSVDWGLAETLVALGAPLVGVAESAGYAQWVSVPPLPHRVTEIGLRSTPNLEMISALKPDLILSTPQFAAIEPVLGTIAPVLSLATFTEAMRPIALAEENTRRLGVICGREAAAEALVAETARRIARLHEAAGSGARPVLVLTFHDDRHVWVFSEGSLYADVLKRAGLQNAWTGTGNAWGIVNTSVDQLLGLEDAAVIIVEPLPVRLRLRLEARDPGTLVGQMTMFEPGRYRILPPNWGFGGLTSAGRFATALEDLADFLRAGDAG